MSSRLRPSAFDDPRARAAKLTLMHARAALARPRDAALVKALAADLAACYAAAAADPAVRDDLLCVRVTARVRWRAGPAELAAMYAVPVDAAEFDARLCENAGDLAPLVRADMAAWGHPPEGPELDDAGVAYAAVCTAARGARLAALLHARYAHELGRGELAVAQAPWGPKFPELLTPEAAGEFLARGRRPAGALP